MVRKTTRERQNRRKPELKKFAIYPDYWPKKYGEIPLLGFVLAENVFHAERKAYDKGLLRKNITFNPKARLATEKDIYNTRASKRKKNQDGKLPMRRPFF